MNGGKRPYVNLASQPLRNRRFYTAVLAALVGLFLLVAVPSGLWLLRASSKTSVAREATAAADAAMYAADRERSDLARRAEALQAKDRELVSQVNAVIARKRFSFVEFFSLLEDALPAGSYITSQSPLSAAEGRIETRFKVVTGGLADLMGLMTKLEALKFKNLTIFDETPLGGRLIAEIGLTYEKTF
jgi:hypothetical protein